VKLKWEVTRKNEEVREMWRGKFAKDFFTFWTNLHSIASEQPPINLMNLSKKEHKF
jgi:hypothetical protein